MKMRIGAVVLASLFALPAFARDEEPRFANERLDALVEQHAQTRDDVPQPADNRAGQAAPASK